ncbi:MAG: bifunctional non-ous end joining protein LigD, partial [Pseudonocardiales bacterium]|nr:bifunctional non-ous end joining protein LigD [Pseudonocardiales bacterium]
MDDDGVPGLVLPMLATPGAPPAGPGWAVEFKWDGIRAIVAAG